MGRCNNPKDTTFKNYGGRGIKYDPKWRVFEWFYEDMKEWYSDDLTIDRIYVEWGYSKENCRWVDRKTQARNRRNNRVYKWKCLAEWEEITWIPQKLISERLRIGWSFNRAVTTKKWKYKKINYE